MEKALRLGLIFLAAVLFSGCLDYDEEMWLNANLSGRVAMTISVPEELVNGKTGMEKDMSEQGVRSDVEKIPGVTLESFESFRDAGKVIAKLRIAFDNVEKLTRHEQGVAESGPASLLGAITLREESGKVIFERTLRVMPQTKSEGVAKDFLTKSLSSLLFSKNHLSYKVHLPGEIVTANSQHIDGKERVVEWKYSLAQAMREPPVMKVEWKKTLPWGWILMTGAIIAGAVFTLRIKSLRKPILRQP